MDTTTAAKIAGVTVATIRIWCRRNVVSAVKRGGRWAIDAASLAYRISLAAADRTDDFVDEMILQIVGAADAYSVQSLRKLLELVKARDTQRLAGIPSGQVRLTPGQWDRMGRDVSFQISCLGAEN